MTMTTINATSRPATYRQMMALHYILKKDTRGMNLTYDEASEMIKKFGNPDYKKSPKSTDDLKSKFLAYYKEHILPTVVASIKETLGVSSEVVEDTNFMKGTGENGEAKRYKFYGFGCSISYLKYDKRSKLAAKIDEMFRSVHYKECRDLAFKAFPKSLMNKLKAEGCPLEALFCQDENINSTMYWGVVRFAKEMGVKNIDYVTRLD